ncbi:hypothetical protein ES703_02141 [subsurface metagenome]
MSERDKEVYYFNILVEAKTRALVQMTKKIHPDWTNDQIELFLSDAMVYAVKKMLGKGAT